MTDARSKPVMAVIEEEANEFAMELLMPSEWLARDAGDLDLTDDIAVATLAKKYQVPAATLAFRVGELRAREKKGILP